MEPTHFIGAVNLARLTDTPLMLPMALYRCCYLESALVDGWTHKDGTVEHLCTEDLKRCMDGSIALERERSFFMFNMFIPLVPGVSAHCKRPEKCLASLRSQHKNLTTLDMITQNFWLSGLLRRPSEALSSWFLDHAITDKENPLCGVCRKELRGRNERVQKWIFDRLPNMFGIAVEGWGKEKSESNAGATRSRRCSESDRPVWA